MRRSQRLPSPFGNRLMGDVLAACAIHGWSQGSSRFGPALPFLECYVLYAGGSSSALDQFFPDDIGLHLGYPGSAPRKWFHKRLHVGLSISARQTFLAVVALQVARPPGRPALRRSARGLLRSSFPSIRHLLDSRVCYPADWSIAGAGPSPARRAAVLGCT
jgi:hypothetical protein